jgi:hypothetical protein
VVERRVTGIDREGVGGGRLEVVDDGGRLRTGPDYSEAHPVLVYLIEPDGDVVGGGVPSDSSRVRRLRQETQVLRHRGRRVVVERLSHRGDSYEAGSGLERALEPVELSPIGRVPGESSKD